MQLGDTRHLLGLTNYLIDNQGNPNYKIVSREYITNGHLLFVMGA